MADPLVIAHRGASRSAPENTLPAIQKALEAGAEMIALEVHGTKDAQPVVFADPRLDRTTNATGRIAERTLAEVRELDAGGWFRPEFTGTRIPTLAEAVAAVGAARLMLTMPETLPGTPLADHLLAALAARANPEADVLLFTDSDHLKAFHTAAPKFSCVLALGEKVAGWVCLEKAMKLGLKIVRPHRAQADAALVRQARQKGLQVFVHFADEEDDMRKLLDLRVDGIVTGRPQLLKDLRDARLKKA